MENEILEDYILRQATAEPAYLSEIRHRTERRTVNPRMCSGHLQGRLLSFLSKIIQPERILEIGTFSGYSSLCLAEGLREGGRLYTIEKNDELESFIRENLSLSSLGKKIELIIGSAEETVPLLNGPFDIVFLDGDKRCYTEDYELVLPLLREGGIIIADNTLWSGHIGEAEYSSDPQTRAIASFNAHVSSDARVEQLLLPLRDGLSLIRKRV